MATTKYEVLCRYYNVDMKMPITNLATEKWISSFEQAPSKTNGICTETFLFCEKQDAALERRVQDLLIEGNNSANEKFNMFFMYKARDFKYSKTGTLEYPYVLMDRMERVILSPWFVHSTHGSLNSAIAKAKALTNLIGHDNIKIGKIVPLDQYIEIV